MKFSILNIFFFVVIILSCQKETRLETEVVVCPKMIGFESVEKDTIGYTHYNLKHEGFCYDMIDSVWLSRRYISGTGINMGVDTMVLNNRYFEIDSKTDDQCTIKIKKTEWTDTAKTITAYVSLIYKNASVSNTDSMTYKPFCAKILEEPSYELLDTSACETEAGTGDRYLVSFKHHGYCTDEIDSISGFGDFYSNDGYYWNSSDFSLPVERILFPENTTYVQKLQFRLCVTFKGSDLVDTQFCMIYHDGSRSNYARIDIVFRNNRKSTGKLISKAALK
ncbi:MAG: hypothetical protein U0W24_17810 [Bacteroidales bacterium]